MGLVSKQTAKILAWTASRRVWIQKLWKCNNLWFEWCKPTETCERHNNYMDSPENTRIMFCPVSLFFGMHQPYAYKVVPFHCMESCWIIKYEHFPEVKHNSFWSVVAFTIASNGWYYSSLGKCGCVANDAVVKLKMIAPTKDYGNNSS